MKKVFSKILVFVLPIIALAYGIDVILSENLRQSNTFAHQEYPIWNDILEGNLNADILIHGSSRAWVHFDPKILEDTLHLPAYNLGVDGHTFNMQELRHKLALKYNKKPKMVIHSVDATTLQKGNFFNSEQILPYMLWDEDFLEFTSNYSSYSFLDYKLPLLRYYGKTNAIFAVFNMSFGPQKNRNQRIRGYKGQERLWNNDFKNAKTKMRSYNVSIDPDLKQRFDDYLKACRTDAIEVVLVYAPVYIEGQDFIQNDGVLKQTYKSFAEKYNITFFDFTNDKICYDKAYFYNARHMNIVGSKLFTKKLAFKIKNEIKIKN